MNKLVNRLRLFFCFFSGEDDYLIRRNTAKLQISFAGVGFFVIIIFIGCWISASLFLSHLFDGNKFISVSIGIVWALLVTNLYLLMLYTITPPLLPAKYKNSKHTYATTQEHVHESPFTFSLFFRIGLIILLALIIIQPYNIYFFCTAEEENKFYAQTLRNLFNTHPAAWLVSLGGCMMFLFPIYVKYLVRKNSSFYERKKEIEFRFVTDHYAEFKEEYSRVFAMKLAACNKDSWKRIAPALFRLEHARPEAFKEYREEFAKELAEEKISKYEYWADPPFRTVKRSQSRKPLSEKDFLNHLYPPEN